MPDTNLFGVDRPIQTYALYIMSFDVLVQGFVKLIERVQRILVKEKNRGRHLILCETQATNC